MSDKDLTANGSQSNLYRRGFVSTVGAVLGIGTVGSFAATGNDFHDPSGTTNTSMDTQDPTGVPPLEVYEAEWLSDQLVELTFENPLMNPPLAHTNVRVLVPPDYDMSQERYPTIYLLHGGEGDAASYTTNDDGPGPVQNYVDDVVVVMPDGGIATWYTDWFNDGAFGAPKVETFHIRQLIPFIESHFRVWRTRQSRVVGGFSMGSVGALKYGARHPDVFAGVFASSGTPYLIDWAKERANQDEIVRPMKGAFRAWGDPREHETRWRGHSPNYLAENYGDTKVYIAVGQSGLDRRAYEFGNVLVDNLEEAGVDYTYETFEERGHEMAWAHRDLQRWQSDIREIFAAGSPGQGPPGGDPPGRGSGSGNDDGFDFRSIDPEFEVWDWQVDRQDVDRETAEFLTLEDVGLSGLTVIGHGMISFVTPAVYRPRADYRISAAGENADVQQETVTADDAGRLDFTVRTDVLSADYDEWIPGNVPSAEITIEPAGG